MGVNAGMIRVVHGLFIWSGRLSILQNQNGAFADEMETENVFRETPTCYDDVFFDETF